MTSPTWCNCSLDVAGRWCRVCRPGVRASRKRAVMPRRKRGREYRVNVHGVEVEFEVK
jgi:ribosomal protein S30